MENELAQLYKVNKLYRETAENELLLKEQISSLQESLRRCKEERQVIPNLEVIFPTVFLYLPSRLPDFESNGILANFKSIFFYLKPISEDF